MESTSSDYCDSLVESEESAAMTKKLTEYQAQYLGFTPKSFCNGVYNAILEYIKEGLLGMEEFINKEFPNEMSTAQTKEASEKIATKLVEKLDRRFDALESYLETNVFNIPQCVLLPEDEVHGGNFPEDSATVDEDIKNLQDKIIALRYANMIMHNDIADMKDVQDNLKEMLNKLVSLKEAAASAGVPNIKDMLIHTAGNVQKLMENLTQSCMEPT